MLACMRRQWVNSTVCIISCVWHSDRSESSSDNSDDGSELWFEQRRRMKACIQAGCSLQSTVMPSRYHMNVTLLCHVSSQNLYFSFLKAVMDFIRRRRLSVFGHIAQLTQGTPAHKSLHCQVGTQVPTLPSWPCIRSFTWQGLETSSWPSWRALDWPTLQRHWICSCQPLETGYPTGPWWSNVTARAGYAMMTTTSTF